MKIFALEGLPCSGKSTFMNRFNLEHPEFECVPELYIEATANNDLHSVQDKYARAEIDKYQKYGKCTKDVLFDRSIFSTLAFSYAKLLTFGEGEEYEFHKKFIENHKELIIPNYIFVLNITPAESIARRKKAIRDNTLDFWFNEDYLMNFSQYYISSDIYKLINKESVFLFETQQADKSAVYDAIRAQISAVRGELGKI